MFDDNDELSLAKYQPPMRLESGSSIDFDTLALLFAGLVMAMLVGVFLSARRINAETQEKAQVSASEVSPAPVIDDGYTPEVISLTGDRWRYVETTQDGKTVADATTRGDLWLTLSEDGTALAETSCNRAALQASFDEALMRLTLVGATNAVCGDSGFWAELGEVTAYRLEGRFLFLYTSDGLVLRLVVSR